MNYNSALGQSQAFVTHDVKGQKSENDHKGAFCFLKRTESGNSHLSLRTNAPDEGHFDATKWIEGLFINRLERLMNSSLRSEPRSQARASKRSPLDFA
jgi:hypothetical protein